MRSILLPACVLAMAMAAAASADDKDKKGTKVELGDLSSTTPGDWTKQKSASTFRAYQFSLPKADGDETNAEVVIFKGLGGSWEQNSGRWKGFFKAPKGKSLDDVTKETKVKVGSSEGDMLDVTGTYTAPDKIDPTFKGKNENFRLIGVQVVIDDTNYHIKFHGPAKTVEKHKKDFDKWLKDFKK